MYSTNGLKICVMDVGNTLIDTKSGVRISTVDLGTLDSLRSKGYILGVATFRTSEMISPILNQFCFDFLVLMNGGLIYADGNIIYDHPFDDGGTKIVDWAIANGVEYKCHTENGKCYAIELLNAMNKNLVLNSYTQFAWPFSGNIDVTPWMVNKTTGVQLAAKHYNCDLNNVIAFGDGVNDIDLIEKVSLGISMGYAPERLLEKAKFITKTAKENGITYACKSLGLI